METIFRWLAGLLAGILSRYADPDLQSKLDAFNEKVAAVEARALEAERQAAVSEAAYFESVQKRKELDRLIQISQEQELESQARLVASKTRVLELEDEARKAKAEIDAKTDTDKVRLDL